MLAQFVLPQQKILSLRRRASPAHLEPIGCFAASCRQWCPSTAGQICAGQTIVAGLFLL